MLEWTYNSNAIEGNTLTINETKVILDGITVGGKTMREHLEVINHRDAIGYVEEIVQKSEPLSEWQIKNLHRIVLKGIDDEYAGFYRDKIGMNKKHSSCILLPVQRCYMQFLLEFILS
nr:hypothetical protein [Bacillus taeanensis]